MCIVLITPTKVMTTSVVVVCVCVKYYGVSSWCGVVGITL